MGRPQVEAGRPRFGPAPPSRPGSARVEARSPTPDFPGRWPLTGRTLILGDVQGCADELELLLDSVAFVPGSDHLVSVGDLVNRGPRSLEVLRLFRQLGADAVLGNHERYLLS